MYITLTKSAEAELTVKHSRFIAFCAPTEGAEEAENFVREIKKRFPDATHAPYAYVAGEKGDKYRASDDGEPSGTSGVPILETIKRQGLTFCAVVVVRYFGGIKLGTGGLARAYSDAAERAISAAGTSKFVKCSLYSVKTDYACYSSVQNKLFSLGGQMLETDFSCGASLTAAVPTASADPFLSFVKDVSSGKASVGFIEERYCIVRA